MCIRDRATIATGVVVMARLIGGGAELPQPTIRAKAAKAANTREDRRTFDMEFPIFLKGWKFEQGPLNDVNRKWTVEQNR